MSESGFHDVEQPPRETIAKVRMVKVLGRGGMGEVWLGRHLTLDVDVAVKIMLPEHAERDPVMAVRFEREAQIAAQIDHQNVVRVLDVGHEDGIRYIVMQFVDGGCVADRLQNGPLPLDEALRVVFQTTQALIAAAAKNIVHRDIKPQNLMLTRDGTIKLADLGLAKQHLPHDSEALATTQAGKALGTPYYMSPEQIQDTSRADIRADIYSLGATFFHLLTGQVPFPGASVYDVMKGHLEKKPPNLNTIRPELPLSVQFVVSRMLAKRAADRYQTPEELAEALERLAADLGLRLTGGPASPNTSQVLRASHGTMPGRTTPMATTLSGPMNPPPHTPAPSTVPPQSPTAYPYPRRQASAAKPIALIVASLLIAAAAFVGLHEPTRARILGSPANTPEPTPSAQPIALNPAQTPTILPTSPAQTPQPTPSTLPSTPAVIAAASTPTPLPSPTPTPRAGISGVLDFGSTPRQPPPATTPTPDPARSPVQPMAVPSEEQMQALARALLAHARDHARAFPRSDEEFSEMIRRASAADPVLAQRTDWLTVFIYFPKLRSNDDTRLVLGVTRANFPYEDPVSRRTIPDQKWAITVTGQVRTMAADQAVQARIAAERAAASR